MPTYQYACTACAERLEVVQRFTDDPLTECPACGGALRKVFSAVGVVFKGSGFYKTDSRKSSGSSSGSASSGESTSSSSSDSSATGSSSGSGGSGSGSGSGSADKPAAAPSTPSSTGKDAKAAS